jgi:tRNA(Ile)-lysidine synthetase-like protein
MLKRLENNLKRNAMLPEHSTYIVAVSGGRDSVVLLDLLSRLRDEWGWDLVVAHLDHGQRADSARDAAFVGALADKYRCKYLLGVLPKKTQSESDLRTARHAWLEEVRRQSEADKIITAHHKNDRLETAIWHALRGADRSGLTSLTSSRDNIVRPLINFSRGDIITYAALRDLEWREDETNDDIGYTRNLIRHELMHFAPTQDPHYHKNLADWVDHLESINARIDRKLDHLLTELGDEISGGYELSRSKFLRLNTVVQLNILVHLARRLTAGRGITENNLLEAMKWWQNARSGSFSEALPGLLMLREYDRVKFVSRSATPEGARSDKTRQLILGKPVRFGKFEIALHNEDIDNSFLLDYHKLVPQVYYVRTWQQGDRIAPVGMQGTKKIQDIFVDSKIPRSERMTWPIVVTAQNEVALVPRLSLNRRFAPSGVDASSHTLAVKAA